VALAQAVERREIDLERLTSADDAEALTKLLQLWGVGRWTSEYVLLRGLGRLHMFPGLDYAAVQNAVEP
jgi:DNA-3-methyladenine glycosylase II